MNLLPRSTPVLVLLAGALVVGASGGAVAGTMITGAQIKDGTVTGADVKNGSIGSQDITPGARSTFLQASPVSGYEFLTGRRTVAGSAPGLVEVSCRNDKVITGAGSCWESVAPQAYPDSGTPDTTFVAQGTNPSVNENVLVLTSLCVEAG